MNNLLSCCGLVDSRISAPEKDLPVRTALFSNSAINQNLMIFTGYSTPLTSRKPTSTSTSQQQLPQQQPMSISELVDTGLSTLGTIHILRKHLYCTKVN